MEDLEEKIGIEQDRKKGAEEKLQNRNKLLVGIREGLDHLVQTLVSEFNCLKKLHLIKYTWCLTSFYKAWCKKGIAHVTSKIL